MYPIKQQNLSGPHLDDFYFLHLFTEDFYYITLIHISYDLYQLSAKAFFSVIFEKCAGAYLFQMAQKESFDLTNEEA